MQKKQWLGAVLGLALVQALALTGNAQDAMMAGRGYVGFQARMEKAVGLTPEQRETVRGLLAQQHQELVSIRESSDTKSTAIKTQTDAKIRALLSPEQQKKFEAFVAKQKQARKAKPRRKE